MSFSKFSTCRRFASLVTSNHRLAAFTRPKIGGPVNQPFFLVPLSWTLYVHYGGRFQANRFGYASTSTLPDGEGIGDDMGDDISHEDKEMVTLLIKYRKEHGDCHVPVGNSSIYREIRKQTGVSDELVRWVVAQRKRYKNSTRKTRRNRDRSSRKLIMLLESIGFMWSTRDSLWQRWFNMLAQIARSKKSNHSHNHTNIEASNGEGEWFELKEEDNPPAGLLTWIDEQRKAYKLGRLSSERESQLKEVGLVFDVLHFRWMESYAKLCKYKEEHGDANVPLNYEKDPLFAYWVFRQRTYYHSGRLTAEKIRLLEDVGLSWNPYQESWDHYYDELRQFHTEHGHIRVPTSETALRRWLDRTRANLKKKASRPQQPVSQAAELQYVHESGRFGNELDAYEKAAKTDEDRLARLRDLEFKVEVYDEAWREHFEELCTYREAFGHAVTEPRDGRLHNWVRNQRQFYRSGKLSEDRVSALESIGFVWDGRDAHWWRSYAKIKKFQADHGQNSNITPKMADLYHWARRQRKTYKKVLTGQVELQSMNATHRERFLALEKIGFSWNDTSETC